jgi:ribosomal protein S18 acetylase RimI-like enzyme
MRGASGSTVKIRPYSRNDWPRVCEIHDAARRDELRASSLDEAFLTLEQTADNEGFLEFDILVAEVDGQVQGFVAFTESELGWLYVDPLSYRKGIGTQLVRAAVEATKQRLTVEVLDGNEAALALYKESGFLVVGRNSGRMPGNETFAVSVTELKYAGAA